LSFDRILVTGASGSLGRQLIYEMAKRGIRPIAMVRAGSNTEYLDSLGLEKRVADLRNEQQLAQAVQGIDAVMHTAAWVNFRQDKLTQFTGVNVFGAANLYRTAADAGVRRFVHVSSVAAVGAVPRSRGKRMIPADETFEFNLDHLRIPYIITKHAAEVELRRLYEEGGPELVIVNPSIVVAPSRGGDDRGKARKRFRYKVMPRLDNYLNLVDIRDIAPAMLAALEKGRAGERYILAGENIKAIELVRVASYMLNLKLLLIPIPRFALNLSAHMAVAWNRFTGRSKQSFYPDLVKMLDYDWAWDSSKARAELGFNPRLLCETLTDILTNDFNGTWMQP